MTKIDAYKTVHENWLKPLFLPIIILFTLIIILFTLVMISCINLKLVLFIIIMYLFILADYHIYRRRYCPSCMKKMKATPKRLLAFPEYYYCDECKLKISTGIENDSWS